MNKAKQILFVYNANSSILEMSVDYLHKLLSPSTYQCSLCLLTHGNFGMKGAWKQFIQQLPLPVLFLYKDDFVKQYPPLAATLFPAVFVNDNNRLSIVLTASEISKLGSLQALAATLQTKLAAA